MTDQGKFRHHKYVWSKPFGSVRHWWELVGPNGAIHFHVSVNDQYGDSAGLEFHHLSGEGAPHHLNCPLTGGRCWHDGTSLYAMETVWPQVKDFLRFDREAAHETIFRLLEHEYTSHFERDHLEAAS